MKKIKKERKERFIISDGCYYYTVVAESKDEAKKIYIKKFGIAYPNNFFVCKQF